MQISMRIYAKIKAKPIVMYNLSIFHNNLISNVIKIIVCEKLKANSINMPTLYYCLIKL